jgi:hypothetical protein
VRCFECQNLGHFARECPNKGDGQRSNTSNQVRTSNNNQGKSSTSTALVTQDGLGFDWSFQADEVVTNQALMAHADEDTKANDDIPNEVQTNLCSASCLKQVKEYREHNKLVCDKLHKLEELKRNYERVFENLENQIRAYVENETKYSDEIAIANWKKNNALKKVGELEIKLEEIKIENDQIRLTIKKYEHASKTVDDILKAQVHGNSKTGIGYNTVAPPFNQNYIPPKVDVDNEIIDEEIEMEADLRGKTVEP